MPNEMKEMTEKVYAPQVSVIVPVYKVESYLHRCVDSILAQTFQDFELLLVDDGSPDRSGEICDEYARKDSRVRVFHKENGGVSSARNLGLDNALGEWVCFVDSDDYLEVSFLKDFNFQNSLAAFYLQGYKVISNNEILSIHKFSSKNANLKIVDLFIEAERRNILNSPVCKLFNRELVSSNFLYFDTNTSYGEDHLFVLNYLQFVQIASVSDTSSYNYVYHSAQSLTRRVVLTKELLHYGLQCHILQTKLLEVMGVAYKKEFISIINTRLYTNMMRTIHDCFFDNNCRKEYYSTIRQTYSDLFSSYIGLNLYQTGIVMLLKYFPSYIAILLFRILVFVKDLI